MRLPKVVINELNVIAQAEQQNGIPAIGADSPGRHAPNAGATHTPNGVSADAD